MGTSQSSRGSPGGVPMVPPWVPAPSPPLPPPDIPTSDDGKQNGGEQLPQLQPVPVPKSVPIAPHSRFGGARLNLGRFARSGDSREMRRGLRHYVRKGYGGAGIAAHRMAGAGTIAGGLYGALYTVASGDAALGSPFDPALLAGRSAQEVMDAVVEVVRPADGTLDSEASRRAIKNALSELLTRYPDANLLTLSEDQRIYAIERYVTEDVFIRIELDLGKTIQEKAPTVLEAVARLKDVFNYVKETVSAAFKRIRDAGHILKADRISQIAQAAIRETFQVFEDYT